MLHITQLFFLFQEINQNIKLQIRNFRLMMKLRRIMQRSTTAHPICPTHSTDTIVLNLTIKTANQGLKIMQDLTITQPIS